MKLFVCWHGKRGERLAGILKGGLEAIVKGLDVFISSGVPKGAIWFEAVSDALKTSDAGLVCLTSDSLDSPWIHYEAGALANRFGRDSGRIYTYLVGVGAENLTGPLSAYQSTAATLGDTKRLVESLVGSMPPEEQSANTDWVEAFEARWRDLEDEVTDIGSLELREIFPGVQNLFRRKTFDEPLAECVDQGWIRRYDGARDTLAELRRHSDKVATEADRFVADAFDQLIQDVYGYVGDLSLLVSELKYPVGDEGRVALPKGIKTACEERRLTVKGLVSRLEDPPEFDEALRFERAETFEEKKALIHRRVADVEGPVQPEGDWLKAAEMSDWAFDRIVFYQYSADKQDEGAGSRVNPRSAVRHVQTEFEKASSQAGSASLIPLYYSLRLLDEAIGSGSVPSDIETGLATLLARIEQYVPADDRRFKSDEVRSLLSDVRVRNRIGGSH